MAIGVLKQYGLRWSVLAAWRDTLAQRGVPVAQGTDSTLERVRIKLASGCFSVCNIGCDLSAIEAELTVADSSTGDRKVDSWIDMLGRAMNADDQVAQLLRVPAIGARYASCGIKGCACARP
jgi:hypothetical protein